MSAIATAGFGDGISERLKRLSPLLENMCFCGSSLRALHTIVELSQRRSGRACLLVLAPPKPSALMKALASQAGSKVVSAGSAALLCRAIAESGERIGAIAVQPEPSVRAQRRYLRRVRDLASAEGALMLCDESSSSAEALTAGYVHAMYGITPDLVCVRSSDEWDSHWLAGRAEILESGANHGIIP
ncbi:hypothetical protein LVJ94_17865 [Pendulispora rubella]|uniref:Uncharacterized protein n=1 Tax=Pendulispora rubella TaxID=2741070 RepID=A0ABZ2LGT0_9BACT